MGDLAIEPVSSSSVGAFAPLLTFRNANMPSTRMPTITMLSTVERPELTRRAATRFRIVRVPDPENACGVPAEGEFYVLPLNRLLVTGGPRVIPSRGCPLPTHS